ncbi:MAG: hypothetical protein V1859_05780 [archaeon]
MASFLDIGFLNNFSSIFVVIFIFTAVYAVLTFKKPLGDNKGINALIAFAVSFIFIFSEDAILVIKNAVPWWTIMIILLIFLVIAKESFGASWGGGFPTTMGSFILIVFIIIFVFAWGGAVGQKTLGYTTSNSSTITNAASNIRGEGSVASGDFNANLGATLFHPKVLGVILILVIALFSVLFITYPISFMK